MTLDSPSSEPRDERRQRLPPPVGGEPRPAGPDLALRPTVVVTSVWLWMAYLVLDVAIGLAAFLSLPSGAIAPPRIEVLVGALLADALMFAFALVMRRGHNWARIVLAVLGGLRLLLLLLMIIASVGNAVLIILWLLVGAAVVTMFMPAANVWFRSRQPGS
jgi:hypothetical protein